MLFSSCFCSVVVFWPLTHWRLLPREDLLQIYQYQPLPTTTSTIKGRSIKPTTVKWFVSASHEWQISAYIFFCAKILEVASSQLLNQQPHRWQHPKISAAENLIGIQSFGLALPRDPAPHKGRCIDLFDSVPSGLWLGFSQAQEKSSNPALEAFK